MHRLKNVLELVRQLCCRIWRMGWRWSCHPNNGLGAMATLAWPCPVASTCSRKREHGTCHFRSVALLVLLCAGCGSEWSGHSSDGRLPVFAGIPPLAYLAEQIGGKHVKVDALVQPGQDPHTFEPKPQQVLALGRAAIFFKIDMPFENVLLEKVQESNPRLKIIDATRGVKKRPMDAPCREDAAGDDHTEQAAGGQPDPHVWLSPPLLKVVSENVAAALRQSDPSHDNDYLQNLCALLKRLDALHERVRRMLAPYRGRSFYVFHPGFGYFADAYGLRQKAVEAGGRPPAPKQLRALIEQAQADGATTIFTQPQYAPQSAEVVAKALGAKLVLINGLGRDPVADIEDIAAKIEAGMKRNSPQRTQRTQREDGVVH